ncbi:MAG TPA: hypothetical protein VJU14_10900 [Solirubrobacterales bacterium]|nr:hypothetical protein [Solirubrobacterales bacterium]
MNPELLAVVPAPSPRWCLGYVEYDGGAIVAALWWADALITGGDGVRHQLPDGTIDEDPAAAEDAIAEPGWYWWIVGDEDPWPYDPRVTVPHVTAAIGAFTPGQARTAVVAELAERPEPTLTRAESLALVERSLPWLASDDEMVGALGEADPSAGTVIVVTDEDEAP